MCSQGWESVVWQTGGKCWCWGGIWLQTLVIPAKYTLLHTCTNTHTLSHWPSMQSCPCLALKNEILGAVATKSDFHFPVVFWAITDLTDTRGTHIQNSNFNYLGGNKSQFYLSSIPLVCAKGKPQRIEIRNWRQVAEEKLKHILDDLRLSGFQKFGLS